MTGSWQDPPEYRGGGGMAPQLAMPRMTSGVRALVYANAAIFVFCFLLDFVPLGNGSFAGGLTRWFGISPGIWREWFPFVPFWQLLSWGFLHSVTDPMHILVNMLFLYFLGTMLEEIVGTRRFLVAYVSALLVSGIVVLVTGLIVGPIDALAQLQLPLSRQYPPTLGASGAVFCVVVAMALLRPRTRIIFILFPITLRTLAILYVGLNVFQALNDLKSGGMASNVSYSAHLAGAAWGFVLVKRDLIWRDPLEAVEAWRTKRTEERAVEDEGRLDALLGKINREGIHSLSASEKAFLKRASKRR